MTDTLLFELRPLPYHEAIRDYLKTEESAIYQWYSGQKAQKEHAEAARFDLLKTTYRLDRESHEDLYTSADAVARRLGLEAPLTIYQAQDPQGLNASLAYIPNEAHLVLHGPLTERLTDVELEALLAHELAHFCFWQGFDGEFLIVDQVLEALAHVAESDGPHLASARLFRLYTEIFCDRAALQSVDDLSAVVAMLVKVHTGLDQVSAESYLRQADEIFGNGKVKTEGVTHPEAFIRVRALRLWHDKEPGAIEAIEQMIEGPLSLNDLDLIAQTEVAAQTRALMQRLLAPAWFRTEPVISQARLYFEEFSSDGSEPNLGNVIEAAAGDSALRDYFCFVMLDLVTADRDLEEAPLAAALQLAEEIGIKEPFAEIAKREMRLRKKQVEKIDLQKEKILAAAKRQNVETE